MLIFRFNPHARVGRDRCSVKPPQRLSCFNPHARVGRDLNEGTLNQILTVSIHTPVWGVTIGSRCLVNVFFCFNPHARVGRDFFHVPSAAEIARFNPHARVGRDIDWVTVS